LRYAGEAGIILGMQLIAAAPSSPDIYGWVVLPVLIFLARICDVSLGTIRLVFVARGYKYLAPLVGFFEVLIWIIAISQILGHLSTPMCYFGYAAGYATGNHVGILIAEKLSLGVVLIRVITQKEADSLVARLTAEDYGVTRLAGQGANGPVEVIFTIVPRRAIQAVVDLVKEFNPHAFYSIEDVDFVERGVFPLKRSWPTLEVLQPLRGLRKGK
jgi:uncharacterized protein YebE (UPF0316 family)